jgi:hypothetical protein
VFAELGGGTGGAGLALPPPPPQERTNVSKNSGAFRAIVRDTPVRVTFVSSFTERAFPGTRLVQLARTLLKASKIAAAIYQIKQAAMICNDQ